MVFQQNEHQVLLDFDPNVSILTAHNDFLLKKMRCQLLAAHLFQQVIIVCY